VYAPLFEEMGRSSEVFPDELLFPMLDAGTASLCYDGQNFFDTDHPVYANHDGTGAVTSVSNYDDNGGVPQTKWYLLDTTRALRPLIYQDRKAMQFTAMTKLDDEAVFTAKQFRYGVDCRANGGYGFWQMAYCSTKPLTAANIWAAIQEMRGFNADGGKPLGIKPNMLVVRGTQQQAALEAMKQTINGDSNTLAGQLEVLVADYM
jgi:phage major head subunit gpT-like protein